LVVGKEELTWDDLIELQKELDLAKTLGSKQKPISPEAISVMSILLAESTGASGEKISLSDELEGKDE
jgi:hypothetical protein